MRKAGLLICLILVFSCSLLSALDPGLIFNQNLEYGDPDNEEALVYKGIFIPRISGLFGDTGSFHVSLGFNYQSNPFIFVPELLRTEISWLYGSSPFVFNYGLGRLYYSDPLGYIAEGLFDGGRVFYDASFGSFSAGLFYTGLLYKRRANIEMTPEELVHNNAPLDYDDFANTYFAPRRMFASLDYEHQGFGPAGDMLAKLALLGQFDLSGEDLHSQYLVGKLSSPFMGLIFELGSCLQLIQDQGNFDTAFTADFGMVWKNDTHRIGLLSRYSSAGFLPLSTITQGHILKPKVPGLSFVSLDYLARLNSTFSMGLSGFYYMGSNENEPGERSLGYELYSGLYWSPFSDLSLNAGGGVFLPAGGASENLWRFEISLILSLY